MNSKKLFPLAHVKIYSFVSLFVSFQAWITLGRAQLNFGEPDSAIESFDRALAIKVHLQYALFCNSQKLNLLFLDHFVLSFGPRILLPDS